jgi:hypothetical protein
MARNTQEDGRLCLRAAHREGAADGQNQVEFFREKQAALEPFHPGLFDDLINGGIEQASGFARSFAPPDGPVRKW